MRTISHTQNRWRGRESILLSEEAQTSLTVTVFITNKQDQVTLQNHSESLLLRDKQQKDGNTVRAEEWHSPEDALLQGIKTWWELPSAALQLKQATKQHPAQFKLLRWLPPHTLSLSHTVEPVSFSVPHSSSFTVIEPKTELLSLPGYHRDPSLRTTALAWGRRLATDATPSKEERGSG